MSTAERKEGLTRRAVMVAAGAGAAVAALVPRLAGARPLPRPPVTVASVYEAGVFRDELFADTVIWGEDVE